MARSNVETMPAVTLPSGRQFAVTWSIPDDFGGMTSALLHRSRAFVRLAETPVDVLTFDGRLDYPEIEARLRAAGELIEGIRLLNLWDWLREHPIPDDAPGGPATHSLIPLTADPGYTSARRGATELSRTRADGATVLQVDYYRADGSLLLSDRRDTRSPGTPGGRSVVLCDANGTPLRSWGSIWGLYRFWLDLVRQDDPAFLIVDSKTAANFMASYRRKGAVTLHLVHGAHTSGGPDGPLTEARKAVFENLKAFDSVVLLTNRQRADVERKLGKSGNLAVIPNGRELGEPVEATRPLGAGIVLAALSTRKRVDVAARAVLAVPGTTLDVYGDGPERATLEALAQGGTTIRLHGHRSDARARLAEASFMLLTSRSEGLPLVLVEAMAAGCIPIAYDIAYGPADLIQTGVNGFLVPADDEAGLARAIDELQRMAPAEVERMRQAARRTAEAFSDLAVTRLWEQEMRKAQARNLAESRAATEVRSLATRIRRKLGISK